jgi:hypothetical protein
MVGGVKAAALLQVVAFVMSLIVMVSAPLHTNTGAKSKNSAFSTLIKTWFYNSHDSYDESLHKLWQIC